MNDDMRKRLDDFFATTSLDADVDPYDEPMTESAAGGSMGGHDPRKYGKIRYIIRSFGSWAGGKHSVCTKRLATEHPELCKGDCNALCAWLKDQWAGTTKWRGSSKDPKQKAEDMAIRKAAGMKESLTESEIDILFRFCRRNDDFPSIDEVVREAASEHPHLDTPTSQAIRELDVLDEAEKLALLADLEIRR